MITVLIPTASRPSLLQVALQSVADQTAVAKISRVVVAENGGDRASETVCRAFPQLPITYLFRDPALSSLENGADLIREWSQGDLTCILHDDDQWLPDHVGDAVAALEAHPDASGYGANFVSLEQTAAGESAYVDRECDLVPWFAADFVPPTSVWKMAHDDILVSSLVGVLVHYSTMVVRTKALLRSTYVYDLGNPYDNDRMVLYAFSRVGPVLYNSKFSAVVRAHANRETMRYAENERSDRMTGTMEWMVQSSGKPWAEIAGRFVQRLARCPDEKKKLFYLREAVSRPWGLPVVARHLDRAKNQPFFALYDDLRAKFAGVSSPAHH